MERKRSWLRLSSDDEEDARDRRLSSRNRKRVKYINDDDDEGVEEEDEDEEDEEQEENEQRGPSAQITVDQRKQGECALVCEDVPCGVLLKNCVSN